MGLGLGLGLALTLTLMWLPMRSVGASAPGRRLIMNMHRIALLEEHAW